VFTCQEIETLENKLDKALIKHGEAATMKKLYDSIIKILQDERIRFDLQLQTFEKTLKVKRQDLEELEAMAQDAELARDNARTEFRELEQKVGEERKEREKEIQRLKDLIRQKRQLDEKLERKTVR
jgi:hypothetical protein